MSTVDPHRLIERLFPRRGGWRLEVPPEAGTFFGHAVRIEFDKVRISASSDSAGRGPLSDAETSLIKTICRHLPALLRECEQRFLPYIDNDVAIRDQIANPHIWINREFLISRGDGHWAFVVEQAGDTGQGWHIEYSGTSCIGIWGGD